MSNAVIDRIVEKVRGVLGKDGALRMGGEAMSEVSEVIPLGVDAIDHYVLGIGGLPVGRIVEIYSEEGVGKTTFAASACAGVQREGGLAVWAETEQALNVGRMVQLGVNVEDTVLLQPGCIEECGQAFEAVMESLPKNGGPCLIVWDSIAATPTRQEIEEGLTGDTRIGVRSQALSRICRSLTALAAEKRTCLLFVNQTREKIGVMFGDKFTTPGGKAVKFHASVRLQMFGGKAVKDPRTQEHTGKVVTILAAKNKLCPPWRKAQVRLDYATGWNNEWSTLNHAKDRKLIDDKSRGKSSWVEAMQKLGWPMTPAQETVAALGGENVLPPEDTATITDDTPVDEKDEAGE